MKKFYLIAFIVVITNFFYNYSYAQFAYPTPQTLTTGKSVSIQPTQSPASDAGGVYSQVTTVAGSGFYGYKDTLALYARFANPVNVAKAPNGDIYVTDANLNVIRKISNGVVTTFAGSINGEKGGKNGQDTTARFNYPTGIAVDAAGNVYVADFGNSLIRKITPAGFVSTYAGNQNSGHIDAVGTDASFSLPYSIACDALGRLWVADTYNNRIRMIATDRTVTTIAGNGAAGNDNGSISSATFNTPKGIAIDPSSLNIIYVTEEGNNSVRKIDLTAGTVTSFATGKFKKLAPKVLGLTPIGITVDNAHNVYISSEEKYSIYKFNPDGTLADSLRYPAFSGGALKGYQDGIDTVTKYNGNMGLFFDGKSSILLTEPSSGYIRSVTVTGVISTPRLPAGLSLSGLGLITGTPTTVQPATTYTITAYGASGASSATITLSIGTGPQVITFNNMPAATYGDADFTPAATSNSTAQIVYTSSNPAVATIVNNKVHVVGVGATNITANQPTNANFTAAVPITQSLQVNKAVLTATANNLTRVEGKDNPVFTASYTGFVNGDKASVIKTPPTGQTTAVVGSPIGTYPITISGAVADNYTFTYLPGTLTVFPLPVITVQGPTTFAKGDSVLLSVAPATGYTYQWYCAGVAIDGATGTSCYATKTGAYVAAITANGYTATSLYVSINAQLQLPPNNFSIKITSVSCKGDNDGSVFISAVQKLKYSALVVGNSTSKSYSFTDTLALSKMSPGNYSVCISVDGESFNQCFQVNITEPKDLSVFSTINKSQSLLNLQLDGGTSFNINLNDVVYTTTNKEIALPLTAGINKLVVTTDKLCQGVIQKDIDMSGITAPYPNPFTGVLNVNVGSKSISAIKVNVVNVISGKSVYTDQLNNRSGILQFDLSGIAGGVYYFNLNMDGKEVGYKIIKK